MKSSSNGPLAPFFDSVPQEVSGPVEQIEGELPSWLSGTYYLNGPGRFERGGRHWRHWLDGDGLVSALALEGGNARYRNRFVRSDKLRQEEEAGRPLFRAFGTTFEGDRLEHGMGLESPVNVNIAPFAGNLLAFGEQGLPWRLDPETLETLEEWDFDRALRAISPFAAHPNFDPATGEMFNFGISFAGDSPTLYLYRFAADGSRLYRRRHALDHPLSIHDFGLSSRFAVFYLAPYVLDVEQVVEGGRNLSEALSWQPELGTQMLWMDRETGCPAGRANLGSNYCLHLIAAVDHEDHLRVDILEMDRPVYDQYSVPGLFPDARTAIPVRYVIDPDGEVIERRSLPYSEMCDFPQIDPRRLGGDYDEFWMLGIADSARPGPKFFDQLIHANWTTGQVSRYSSDDGRYLGGEPVFAPHPEDADRGAILCQELVPSGPSTAILVFDAHAIREGPVARLHLSSPAPPSFHGVWVPS